MATYLDKVCQRILLPSGAAQDHMRFELSERLLPGVTLTVQKTPQGEMAFQFEAQVGASHAFLLAHKEQMARYVSSRTHKHISISVSGQTSQHAHEKPTPKGPRR